MSNPLRDQDEFICGVSTDSRQAHVLLVLSFICVSSKNTFRLLIGSFSSLFSLPDDGLVIGSVRVHHPPMHIHTVLAYQKKQFVPKYTRLQLK